MSLTPLWVRAIRSRPLSALLLVALSAVAVATAALGPLLVRAMDASTLAQAVSGATSASTGMVVSVRLDAGSAYAAARTAVAGTMATVDQGPSGDLWAAPQSSTTSSANVEWSTAPTSGETVRSRLTAGPDGCRGLVVTDGRCPAANGETLLSQQDSDRLAVKNGAVVSFALPDQPVRRLTVVGRYDATRSLPGQLVRPGTADSPEGAPDADPLVVTDAQLGAIAPPVTIALRLGLRDQMSLDEVTAARRTLDLVSGAAATGVPGRVLFFDSRLPTLLDGVAQQSREAAVLVGVTVVQAFALALFALTIVLQRIGQARAAEWGIAQLRGLPWWRSLVSSLVEPGLAVLVGLPVGLALAAATGRLTVDARLRAGTTVEPFAWPVLAAAAAAVGAALLALLVLTVLSLGRPAVELIQQSTERRRTGVPAAVAQATVLLVAAASIYQLITAGTLTSGGSRLGLLAPALIALAAAVVAVRVAVIVVRRITRRAPRTRVGLVVGRQAARVPSTLNPAVVIAAGLALAVFATQVLTLSTRNQDLRADAQLGANTVLQVDPPSPHDGRDLIAAVDAADPTGRYAMAVQEKATSSDGNTSRIVAVDATRFDAVTSWRSRWADVTDVGARLHPNLTAPVQLRGSTVTVALADVSVRRGQPSEDLPTLPSSAPSPQLSVVVESGLGKWKEADLGTLRNGSNRFTADLADPPAPVDPPWCQVSCRLVGFRISDSVGAPISFAGTITGVATDVEPASGSTAWLSRSGWYRHTGDLDSPEYVPSTVTVRPTAAGLRVTGESGGLYNWLLTPGDTTNAPAALLAPRTADVPFPGEDGAVLGTGLDGQVQHLTPVGRAAVLPRSLDDGVLVDLNDMAALSPTHDNEATSEVWLAPGAPADAIVASLTTAGITVSSQQTLAATRDLLHAQPTTRGAAVAVTLAYAALLLTLLTLVAARVADASRRRTSWRSLTDAGLPRRSIAALVLAEVTVPALLGAAVGLASGALAIRLTAPRLPLVDTVAPGPPLELAVAWWPVAAVGLGTAAAVVVVGVLAALLETRREAGQP